ncbi:MAG: magnesium protoporphyrin IX methyltransferase, partial [Alphaproteobacteria bacterium]|nr:magnesium protoporphyrin IX methyltransferase [Alphaproteobacteria bacterium]
GMDSMIHYKAGDMAAMLAGLAKRTHRSILLTHAPRTPMLTVMHAVGRMFPQGNRAPFIEPISNRRIRELFLAHPEIEGWTVGRDLRVTTGFYMSHAQELVTR